MNPAEFIIGVLVGIVIIIAFSDFKKFVDDKDLCEHKHLTRCERQWVPVSNE